MPSGRSSGAVNEPAAATTWSPVSVVRRSVLRSPTTTPAIVAPLLSKPSTSCSYRNFAPRAAQSSASFCVKTRASPDSSLGVYVPPWMLAPNAFSAGSTCSTSSRPSTRRSTPWSRIRPAALRPDS